MSAWDAVGTQAFTAAALSPAEGHVIFGYAGIAVYDAVMAVRHKYEPFAIRTSAPRGTSPEAAVVAAAHRIYEHYLPAPGGHDPRPGVRRVPGHHPRRAGEGSRCRRGTSRRQRSHRPAGRRRLPRQRGLHPADPALPGDWVPTAATPPLGTYLGQMQPFGLESADQFRPDGPPPLGSKRWARDYNEVKEIGSRTSTTRKDWQTTAALFWAEPPVQQAHLALRGVITQHKLDIVQAARMMAMVSVAYADGIIACFDAKYAYEFWRPITAIREATPTAMTQPSPTRPGCTSWQGRRTTLSTRVPTRASRLLAGRHWLRSWELDAST